MTKHLRRNPIALLALFVALGGTSYAAAVPVPVPGPAPAAAGRPTPRSRSCRWARTRRSSSTPRTSSGITAANISAAAENTVCLNGLKTTPRNLQVTSKEVMLPAVQISPKTGLCTGKQASISFWTHAGDAARYGSFYLSVVA